MLARHWEATFLQRSSTAAARLPASGPPNAHGPQRRSNARGGSLGQNALEEAVDWIAALASWRGQDDPVPPVCRSQPVTEARRRNLVRGQVGDAMHAAVRDDDDQHLMPHIDQCDPSGRAASSSRAERSPAARSNVTVPGGSGAASLPLASTSGWVRATTPGLGSDPRCPGRWRPRRIGWSQSGVREPGGCHRPGVPRVVLPRRPQPAGAGAPSPRGSAGRPPGLCRRGDRRAQ
jgi:hypothetical protein